MSRHSANHSPHFSDREAGSPNGFCRSHPVKENTEAVSQIPLVDLFAGPGGLSEGFSAFELENGVRPFRVALSIEADQTAHHTLELRSFFRQFGANPPKQYFAYLQKIITRGELFKGFPTEAKQAQCEAWNATLGKTATTEVDDRIKSSLTAAEWVLIGGPPCQAYSMPGRSRNGGIDPEDTRVFLYKEYLRILAVHKPPVFVMENVKGLLSARTKDSGIFHQMLRDLENPTSAWAGKQAENATPEYRIFSLVEPPKGFEPNNKPVFTDSDFVIKCEEYGIPQARHRVILLGVKNHGPKNLITPVLKKQKRISTNKIISGLPRLRSGLSRGKDSPDSWIGTLQGVPEQKWFSWVDERMQKAIREWLRQLRLPKRGRGGEFIRCRPKAGCYPDWYLDRRMNGVCNHSSREHFKEDLFRYLFCAVYGKVNRKTPLLADFPPHLLPEHENVLSALEGQNFPDRFRVQVGGRYATTITSHIARDGHYYIHPDPRQCRSFTVREAARLQTFPDNYFFEGNRTQQYGQVGNAVPPLLARQVAEVVWHVLKDLRSPSPEPSRLLERKFRDCGVGVLTTNGHE